MKKRVLGKKLSRSRSARRGLIRSQVRSFAEYGKIETTLAKAKFTQKFVEKLLSRAVVDSVHTRRIVAARLANDRKTLDLLFKMAKAVNKKSGFTRIIHLPSRRGDASLMARLTLTYDLPLEEKKKVDEKSNKKVKKDIKRKVTKKTEVKEAKKSNKVQKPKKE